MLDQQTDPGRPAALISRSQAESAGGGLVESNDLLRSQPEFSKDPLEHLPAGRFLEVTEDRWLDTFPSKQGKSLPAFAAARVVKDRRRHA